MGMKLHTCTTYKVEYGSTLCYGGEYDGFTQYLRRWNMLIGGEDDGEGGKLGYAFISEDESVIEIDLDFAEYILNHKDDIEDSGGYWDMLKVAYDECDKSDGQLRLEYW